MHPSFVAFFHVQPCRWRQIFRLACMRSASLSTLAPTVRGLSFLIPAVFRAEMWDVLRLFQDYCEVNCRTLAARLSPRSLLCTDIMVTTPSSIEVEICPAWSVWVSLTMTEFDSLPLMSFNQSCCPFRTFELLQT